MDCDDAEGCQPSWVNFCGELSVLESGDEELTSPLFLQEKCEHPGECTMVPVVRTNLIRAMKRRENDG